MKHILARAGRRLEKAALKVKDIKGMERCFNQLQKLLPEFRPEHPSYALVGEYSESLAHRSEESLTDMLEEVLTTLEQEGYLCIKEITHLGTGSDVYVLQKGDDQWVLVRAHKQLGRTAKTWDRMICDRILLTPVTEERVNQIRHDPEEV